MTAAERVFPARWRAIKAAFDAEAPAWIERFFADGAPGALPLITELVTAGKSARGCLVCLVCEALQGSFDEAMPRAVVIECVQAASLVHDDFVDDDSVRRARPATWKVLGARRAVLLGDLMFATAIGEAARLSRADVATLAQAIAMVARGAYREPIAAAELDPDAGAPRTLYEHVVHCKTGALFGAAGRLGAIAAHASADQIAAAGEFATRVGEAYQMADDVADLLGPAVGVPRSDAKTAALAALRAHFDADPRRASATEDDLGRVRDEASLRPRVHREIAHRVRLARGQVDAFASGDPAALLHAAPDFIVGLQRSSG